MTSSNEPNTRELLIEFGNDARTSDVSVAVGEVLTDEFLSDGDAADHTVVASGTSCLVQLEDLTGRPWR